MKRRLPPAPFTMAWLASHPPSKVIACSTTLVDQQDDDAPEAGQGEAPASQPRLHGHMEGLHHRREPMAFGFDAAQLGTRPAPVMTSARRSSESARRAGPAGREVA
ncbi:putative secreted protein [Sorangium cellulosum So ce56]|uniref:Secreted protein n=1 Tax=Sorangium cellulosum (strain So ce56) TaxID=448385 RepID=A9GY80_SORC5|nr:putative secreted protein [Sorangium cellulosum So ce56]